MHGFSAEESKDIVDLVVRECPWFGRSESVADEIGVDMLADVIPTRVAATIGPARLVEWHNANARNPMREADVASAYADLVETVKDFGVEDGGGSGDFWVMEDSFSGSDRATVMVFNPSMMTVAFKKAVVDWLHGQSTMKTVALVDREGEPLFESRLVS